jgi:hypothetical protein
VYCSVCDLNCKQCSGTTTQCTKCFGTYVVQPSGRCACDSSKYETPEHECVDDCSAVVGKTYYSK